MNAWIMLWKIVFVVGVILFAAMAVWVSIGGLFDIKKLFARLAQEHEQQPDEL